MIGTVPMPELQKADVKGDGRFEGQTQEVKAAPSSLELGPGLEYYKQYSSLIRSSSLRQNPGPDI